MRIVSVLLLLGQWIAYPTPGIPRTAEPWTVTVPKNLMVDTELIEFMCENEKDYVHLVGK
jgi:hypothetical protein